MTAPMLILVTGRPGSGKTTLAHAVAGRLGCPAICRDEIKEGLVHAAPEMRYHDGDPLQARAYQTFFAVLRLLVEAGTTVVAEAAFQDRLWRPGLEPVADLARIRIVRCGVDVAVARDRIAHRASSDARRAAHDDQEYLDRLDRGEVSFTPISLVAPTIDVDTTDGYRPGLEQIMAFLAE